MRLALRFFTLLVGAAALLAASPDAHGDAPLPRGLHRVSGGNFVQDVTDWSASRHALSRRLLSSEALSKLAGGPGTGGGGQSSAFCTAQANPEPFSSPPSGSLGPAEVLSAYDLTGVAAGTGAIVGVVEMPDSTAASDLATYRKAYGLPALPACTSLSPLGPAPCLAMVDQSGTTLDPAVTDCPGSDSETGLDMGMVSAACPACTLLVVQMTSADTTSGPSNDDLLEASHAAAKLGAAATSISFGGPETAGGGDPTGYSTAGHLVLAASGDEGYLLEELADDDGNDLSPAYPASSPDVLAVGGTTLEETTTGVAQVVWHDASGATTSGCSTEFAMPAFQAAFGASAFGSCTMRADVDVAGVAEYAPANTSRSAMSGGIAEYDSQDQWGQVVGTSAAAPAVAAVLARLGVAAAVSSDFGILYQHEAVFNDVTSGTNSEEASRATCKTGDALCTAGTGWDGPTGLGTPDGTELAKLAANLPAETSSSSSTTKAGCAVSAEAEPGGWRVAVGAFAFTLAIVAMRRRKVH